MPTPRQLTSRQLVTLLCTFAATTALAQEESIDSGTAKPTWRESVIARCVQQYSAEQCQDEQFLEDNFHLNDLQIAHRAATQSNRLQREALRELTLQRVCNTSPSSTCAGAAQPGECAVKIKLECSALAQQVAYCAQNAQLQCATNTQQSACIKQRSAPCPSLKKQPIDVFLAKYPKLKPEQKIHLANTAKQLDAQQGWFTNLLDWIGL